MPKGHLCVPLVLVGGRRGSGRSSGVPGTATTCSWLESEGFGWFAELSSDLPVERVLRRIMAVLWTNAFLWCPTVLVFVYKHRVSCCEQCKVKYVDILSVVCHVIE
jgi:hypothetical protein